MSTKAREFWIEFAHSEIEYERPLYDCTLSLAEPPLADGYTKIHVIEYSAYEELKKETAKLKRTNERLAMRYKELVDMRTQNEIMRDALISIRVRLISSEKMDFSNEMKSSLVWKSIDVINGVLLK